MLMERKKLKVLLVSPSLKAAETLLPALKSAGLIPVFQTDTASRARKYLAGAKSAELAVINGPLPDDPGLQLAVELADKNLGVLVLVKNEIEEQTAWRLEPYGIVTLGKPLSAPALLQALKMLRAFHQKISLMDSQRINLEDKMREIRLINRAKWLLIDRLSFSEAEANRYIEKTAMDTCQKKQAIAEQIIRTYQT